jgi:hypothetical protein
MQLFTWLENEVGAAGSQFGKQKTIVGLVVIRAQSFPVPNRNTGVGEPNDHTSRFTNRTAQNLAR